MQRTMMSSFSHGGVKQTAALLSESSWDEWRSAVLRPAKDCDATLLGAETVDSVLNSFESCARDLGGSSYIFELETARVNASAEVARMIRMRRKRMGLGGD